MGNVIFTHVVIGVVRVATSYRSIELELNVAWLGVIAAAFAILPIFVALKLGQFIDRGYDAHSAWMGAIALFAASLRSVVVANLGLAPAGLHHPARHRPHVSDGSAPDADAALRLAPQA